MAETDPTKQQASDRQSHQGGGQTRRQDSITRPDVPAQDLPDGGRGDSDTNLSKQQFDRDNPHNVGGQVGGEGGLRNEPGMDDLDRHGGRKKN